MRIRTSYNTYICRLLTLPLILLVGASQGLAFSPVNFNRSKIPSSGTRYTSGPYMLYNRCSQKFVRIRSSGPKGIDARGNIDKEKFAILESIVVGPDQVFLRGKASQLYLCFNRKGKLRARIKRQLVEVRDLVWKRYCYDRHKAKRTNCLFSQRYLANGFVSFSLVANETWRIGFKKGRKGKALYGYIRKARMEICYTFQLNRLGRKKDGPINFRNISFPLNDSRNSRRKNRRRIRHHRNKNRRRGHRRRKQKDRTINR